MKLKWLLLAFISVFCINNAMAADAGMRFIKTNGKVRCGTDLHTTAYARKDQSGIWRGIDADMCRVFSYAAFGRGENFEMINVDPKDVDSALAQNKVDIMLGNAPFSASAEAKGKAKSAEIIYYDRLVFLGKNADKASSMEFYKGKNICTVGGSEDLFYLELFMQKYTLDLNMLMFPNMHRAKESFLLNRCELIIGSETMMKSIEVEQEKKGIKVLPEVIAYKPIYALTIKDNDGLQIAIKWIMNALVFAEEVGMNSKNVDIFAADKNKSIRNLLGNEKEAWQALDLNPDWLKSVIKEIGNYGDIYENNLGKNSPFALKRDKSNLIKNGGVMKAQIFL